MLEAGPVSRPKLTISQVLAIKAWEAGEATPDQQRASYECVLNDIAVIFASCFYPDVDGGLRRTDFALGKRYVGISIKAIVDSPVDHLVDPEGS